MNDKMAGHISKVLGKKMIKSVPLAGGCVGDVYLIHTDDMKPYVVKLDEVGGGSLKIEGQMLKDLKALSTLPIPEVFHSESRVLIMEFLPGSNHPNKAAEPEAAELLVSLHNIESPNGMFGYDYPTAIASLPQPNEWNKSWINFFRDNRLLHMAQIALTANELPLIVFQRIQALAGNLGRHLVEPGKPGLVHGDLWHGNVLIQSGKITGIIDPAIYFGDPEIELAFISLFNTFGDPFWVAYAKHRKISPEFWKVRRYIYNLYPLLVHVTLFGESYVTQVEQVLDHLGY